MAERVLRLLFFSTGGTAYLVTAVLGCLPIAFAYLIDAGQSVAKYHGYYHDNFNWLMFPVALPISLWIARTWWRRILPESPDQFPTLDPIRDPSERHRARKVFVGRVLSGSTLGVLLTLTVSLNVIDYWNQPGQYYWRYWQDSASVQQLDAELPDNAKDWSTLFVGQRVNGVPEQEAIGFSSNVVLSILAYVNQLLIALLGLSLLVLIVHYNVTFLSLVYQHRYRGKRNRPIVVNICDPNWRFGLKRTNLLFTLQVATTFVVGLIILASRVANVRDSAQSESIKVLSDSIPGLSLSTLNLTPVIVLNWFDAIKVGLTDPGQVILILAWTGLFLGTLLPVFIKMLPAFPNPFAKPELIGYLREFMPDGSWKKDCLWEWGECTRDEDVLFVRRCVAPRFAEQFFWPNGDRWAMAAIWLATFMWQWMLLPIEPFGASATVVLTLFTVFGSVSGAATLGLFLGLKTYLRMIDVSLVQVSKS